MEHTTKNEIFLKKGEIREITPNSVVKVKCGLVWITIAGDRTDYVLKTGDELQIFGTKPVIEAISHSDIQIQEPVLKYTIFSTIMSWNADVFN